MKALSYDKFSILIVSLAFLGAGVIYWTIPYGQIEMLSQQFILKWLTPAVLVGFIAVPIMKKHPVHTSIMITIGFIAAVLVRLIYDTTIDSTTHNLWPFEVAITIIIAFPTSLIGSTISQFIFKTDLKK